MSTSRSGAFSRIRRTGSSDWPPAITLASSLCGERRERLLDRGGGEVVELGGDHAPAPSVRSVWPSWPVDSGRSAVPLPRWSGRLRRHHRHGWPATPARGCTASGCRCTPNWTDRVDHRVDDGRRRGDGAGLADALGPERVGQRRRGVVVDVEADRVGGRGHQVVDERRRDQRARLVVDRLLPQRLGDALHQPAVHLAGHDQRVDHVADVVDAGVLAHLHLAGLGVDLDRAQVRAVRVVEVHRVVRRVGVDRRAPHRRAGRARRRRPSPPR